MDVEATYIRRRFEGLSLEEQRKIAAKRKRKKSARKPRITRRRSSAATESSKSSKSSVKLTPYSRRAKIRSANPFGLQVHINIIICSETNYCTHLFLSPFPPQDWQLKMTGIDISSPGTEENVFDDDEEPHSPIGALNPLLLDNADGTYAKYGMSHSQYSMRYPSLASSCFSHSPT